MQSFMKQKPLFGFCQFQAC